MLGCKNFKKVLVIDRAKLSLKFRLEAYDRKGSKLSGYIDYTLPKLGWRYRYGNSRPGLPSGKFPRYENHRHSEKECPGDTPGRALV